MGITWNTYVMGGYNLYQEVFYNKIRKIEWYYLYVNSYLNINGMNSGKPVDEIFPDLSTKTNYLIQDPKLYDLILKNLFQRPDYYLDLFWNEKKSNPYLIKNVDRIKNDKLFEIIEFLIDQKFDFNQKDIKQNSSLHYLNRIGKNYCFRPPIKILILLLQKGGADPNIQDKNNKTILHYYSENFQSTSHLIKLFIENGANPNIRDDQLQTPFHKIISNNDDSEDEELKEKKEKERKEKQILNQNFDNIFEEFEIILDNKNFNLEKSIRDLFSDEKSKNFKIVIDKTKEEIKVHKFILYSRSGLYNGMFLNIDNKNINKVRDYSQRSLEAMKIFIEYLYTDRIDQDKLS
ncbi:ankyrin repeat-containing protein [Anaeramoeba flamelloides]|uniref:Ankyrin repeat domain-containing protein 54 n=1 Tax=Anaeramoeba flamelloides TaxID=1746091 RepID=A0AAV7YK09_9EUKA|nr:ankyrin repeat-containing protein [Anaeramoeba flamelloides]